MALYTSLATINCGKEHRGVAIEHSLKKILDSAELSTGKAKSFLKLRMLQSYKMKKKTLFIYILKKFYLASFSFLRF